MITWYALDCVGCDRAITVYRTAPRIPLCPDCKRASDQRKQRGRRRAVTHRTEDTQ